MFELTAEQERDLMAQALAGVQESQPTWRKADLIRHLGELLPDDVVCRDDRGRGRAAGAAGATGCWPAAQASGCWRWKRRSGRRCPTALRRADGRSIYRPHGGDQVRDAAQLSMEERLTAQAQQRGAPCLAPEQAARLLGADQAQLEAQLGAAHTTPTTAQQVTGSGLRLDQAAAAFARADQ